MITPIFFYGDLWMRIEIEQSKKIYQGRAFDVRKDYIRLPNGSTKQRDVVEHPPAVTILPVDEEKNIWFIRQYRHPVDEVLLELPAGVMDQGESPIGTAQREIREEIGMYANHLELIGKFYLAPGYSTELMYVFLARELSRAPLPADDDEFISIEKIPIHLAFRTEHLRQLRDAKTIAALLLVRDHLINL